MVVVFRTMRHDAGRTCRRLGIDRLPGSGRKCAAGVAQAVARPKRNNADAACPELIQDVSYTGLSKPRNAWVCLLTSILLPKALDLLLTLD